LAVRPREQDFAAVVRGFGQFALGLLASALLLPSIAGTL